MLLGFWGGKKYGWNLRGNHERIQEINREQEKLSNLAKIFSIILSVQSTHLTPSLEDQLKEINWGKIAVVDASYMIKWDTPNFFDLTSKNFRNSCIIHKSCKLVTNLKN